MLGTMTLEDAAQAAAGNWKGFDSFVWWREREMDDSDRWAIVYTSNRDSGLIDQSNSAVIAKALEPFTEDDQPTVVAESHSHWLVGFVKGYSIQVYDDGGNITEAFKTYFELQEQIEAYPLLDESDYSDREFAATLENIDLASWSLEKRFDLPEDWVGQVYDWLSENDPNQIENVSDQGGWPDEDSLEAAFTALNFKEQE